MPVRDHRSTSRRSRLVTALVAVLAGTSALLGFAAPAIAQTKSVAVGHATKTSYAAVEKSLSTYEVQSSATVTETGSSLFYPLFSLWAAANPLGLHVTAQSSSSGTGQTSAETGLVNIGTSDSYLPIGTPGVLNIPEVVSAQAVNYNIPGLKQSIHLHLNADVLSAIYSGTITNWDDPAIQAINKGVKIPSVTIVPLHRSGSSGDTFIFTYYVASQDPSSWISGGTNGVSGSTTFPNAPGALAEGSNQLMESTCVSTPGCIAYIGISYLSEALGNGLGQAELKNGYTGKGGGNYVLPTPANIAAEVASYKNVPANGTLSMINSSGPKDGYPIVNFEYAIVKPGAGAAVAALLAWGMDPRYGAAPSYLDQVKFQALSPSAIKVALALIAQVA